MVIALSLIELLLTTFAIISYNNKTLDKYIFGSSDLKNTNLFAIMIEDDNGEYQESSTSSFPSYDYYYNHTKSSCIDLTGKEIENSLLYNQDAKTVTVTIGETTGCYLYFDNWEEVPSFANDLIDSGNLWQSGLEGDGYRYVGTDPDNFICFGTTDESECTANQDKYMYRIIGIFPDASNRLHIKLIKYKQLDSKYKWNAEYEKNISWENSDMYNGLNGSYFLTNTTYDYLQNDLWLNKIDNWTWSAVNSQQYSNSGPNYLYTTSEQLYLHEMNRSTKTSTVGEWTTPSAKIGLMYVSDYALSLGSKSLTLTTGSSSNAALVKTGWMHQSNNDTTKSTDEWTISRKGVHGAGYYYGIYIDNIGEVYSAMVHNSYGVRPTFYLLSSTLIPNGSGSLENPYIISEDSNDFSINVTKESNKLVAKITKGKGNPVKYCINNSKSISNCTWNTINSFTINYTMTKEGTYYVHVIDDAGYIVNGSVDYLTIASQLIKSGDLWQSGLEGDGYRYVGSGAVGTSTNPDNFICFGTTNKTECTSNQDKYMYRIIGVFADSNGNNHVKLIKYKQLNSYIWNSDYQTSVSWEKSDMYKGLNGSYFLTNTTYDYLQDTTWSNKIENWTWSAVLTQTYINSGPDYYDGLTPSKIYLHEMNRSTKTSAIGEWTNPVAKIGLMYVSDYALSLGLSSLEITGSTNNKKALLKTGWMHQSNNDTAKSTVEWTISNYGAYSSFYYFAWIVHNGGYVSNNRMDSAVGVRPTFYLTSDVISSSGIGTADDPYIIDN